MADFFRETLADLKYLHTSAFYLWAVALTIVMGQTTRSLVNSTADVTVEMLIAFAGLDRKSVV